MYASFTSTVCVLNILRCDKHVAIYARVGVRVGLKERQRQLQSARHAQGPCRNACRSSCKASINFVWLQLQLGSAKKFLTELPNIKLDEYGTVFLELLYADGLAYRHGKANTCNFATFLYKSAKKVGKWTLWNMYVPPKFPIRLIDQSRFKSRN
jgi:hypothetical protein